MKQSKTVGPFNALSQHQTSVTSESVLAPTSGTQTSHMQPAQVRSYEQDDASYFIYSVTKGDTLGSLATRFRLSVFQLAQANPRLTSPTKLDVGTHLRIPIQYPALPHCQVLQVHPQARLTLPPAHRPLGSVTSWRTPQGFLALTFTCLQLPHPVTWGDFDTYLGQLCAEQPQATVIHACGSQEDSTIWCGTLYLSEMVQLPSNTLLVLPFNNLTAISGAPLLKSDPFMSFVPKYWHR